MKSVKYIAPHSSIRYKVITFIDSPFKKTTYYTNNDYMKINVRRF